MRVTIQNLSFRLLLQAFAEFQTVTLIRENKWTALGSFVVLILCEALRPAVAIFFLSSSWAQVRNDLISLLRLTFPISLEIVVPVAVSWVLALELWLFAEDTLKAIGSTKALISLKLMQLVLLVTLFKSGGHAACERAVTVAHEYHLLPTAKLTLMVFLSMPFPFLSKAPICMLFSGVACLFAALAIGFSLRKKRKRALSV